MLLRLQYVHSMQDVPAAQVKIVVLDNVMLRPGHDVFILVNTSVTYSVVRLRQGKAAGLCTLSPTWVFANKLF